MLTIMLAATLGACKKDNGAAPTTTYPLQVKDQLGVSGTITFTQTSSTVTTVDIVVTGGDMVVHPAYIRSGAAIETGPIAITLNPVVGGKSTTRVTTQDNASAINYSQFLGYDGYVDIDESSTVASIIAQGDIGGNVLTSTTQNYVLDSIGGYGVSGTALFTKRTNGNTLVSITLTGGIAGGVYPAAIHLGSVTTVGGGPVAKTLTSVDGTTGKSYTNIRTLDSGTPITYDGLMVYDGYLAVQQSATLPVTICQGNIGTH
jgi:hypothetical protein